MAEKKSDNLIKWTPQQARAITETGGSILVAASAGSGKTSVMIQRVAAILADGASLKNMLIVTFTVNAAAEMKTRLYKLLEEKQAGIRREDINMADIGTLHSFCKKLITQFFYKLDIDPGFVVAEPSEAAHFRGAAADAVLEHYFGAGDPVFYDMADFLAKGRRDNALKNAIKEIYEFSHNSADADAWLSGAHGFIESSAAECDRELAPFVRKLAEAAALFSDKYDAIKKREARLDFTDLERLALRLMDDGETARAVREKYKYVFVDEYQDINPKQEAIITAAAAGGSLFMVGDVKQSIYGFRSCEPRIFAQKLRDTKKHNVIMLNDNFRSRPEILKYCDCLFTRLMTEESCGIAYAPDNCFNAGAAFEKASEFPAVSCRFAVGGGAEEEARVIADAVARIMGEKIYSPKEKKLRPVEYGDIVILMGVVRGAYSRAVYRALAAAGLPVRSEINLNLFELPCVRLLTDFMKIIDNPRQDIPLAAVMRSCFFRFTDNELARIRQKYPAEKFFHVCVFNAAAAAGGSPEDIKLAGFVKELTRLKEVSAGVTAARLLEMICRDYDYEGEIIAGDGGVGAVKEVETFISIVRADRACLTLGGFCGRADTMAGEAGTEPSVAAASCIRLSTVHHAKGMEFPVVILSATGVRFTDRGIRRDIAADKDLGLGLKPRGGEEREERSAAFYKIAAKRFAEENMEKQRLLYVALTRAKNHLIITGAPDKEKAEGEEEGAAEEGRSFLDWLISIRPEPCEYIFYPKEDFRRVGRPGRGLVYGKPDPDFLEAYLKAPGAAYSHAAAAAAPLKTTATKINEAYAGDLGAFTEEYEGEYRAEPRVGGGREREKGIAYHTLLKYINLGAVTHNDITAEASRLISEGLLTADAAALIDVSKAEAVMRSGLMDRARAAVKLWREKDFLYLLKGEGTETLVQGTVDLMFTEGDALVIADYKLSSQSGEAVARHYKKQLEIYAQAAKEILGLPVKEKVIYLISRGQEIKV